jgi:hypothetical protein
MTAHQPTKAPADDGGGNAESATNALRNPVTELNGPLQRAQEVQDILLLPLKLLMTP